MIDELSADEARMLLASIRKAFPSDKLFPSDGAIVEGAWFDERGQAHPSYSIEGEEIARVFAGSPRWTDVSSEKLMRGVKAGLGVMHLTPAALAFYLPAYLSACLILPLDADIDIEEFLDCLTSRLTPPEMREANRSDWAMEHFPDTRTDAQRHAMDEDSRRRFQRLVGEFNDAQKSVIAAFLEEAVVPFYENSFYKECGEENRAKLAFDSFWFRFRTP